VRLDVDGRTNRSILLQPLPVQQIPGYGSFYVVTLSVLSFLAASVTFGLVQPRGNGFWSAPSRWRPVRTRAGGHGKVQRRFTIVVATETAAIIAAANILARSGHAQWIPAVICALVGLHFIPLARLFSVALYYATAWALCLVSSATMILGTSGAPTSVWQLLPGFGAALVLWSTSAGLLVTSPASPFPTWHDPSLTQGLVGH
jgi:hypothetical protein